METPKYRKNTHCLLRSPITGHNIYPNAISGMVKLHEWCVVPVAIEISTRYLLVEKMAYIARDERIFLGHPLWRRLEYRAAVTEWHTLPRVIALSNRIDSVEHLLSRSPGYVVVAIFGRLRRPELQGIIDR